MKTANLGLRFALELGALVAVGWWGWDAGGIVIAVLAPLAFAAVWGALVAPKARFAVPRPVWWTLNVVLFGLAALALGAAWSAAAGAAFAVLAAVSLVVLAV